MPSSWFLTAVQTLSVGLRDTVSHGFDTLFTYSWDIALAFLNLIAPKKRIFLTWPEYVPRKETDSRSACPALNALSNHGIFPHDGRGITFTQMATEVNRYYNCSPSLCYTVCNYIARILKRDYKTDILDLSDISVHNGIEHDASITRYDAIIQPDQSVPARELINDILSASKDDKKLTAADFSRVLHNRLVHSKSTNSQFSLSSVQLAFGGGNAATLLLIFGGEVADIRPFLLEERIPEGWTSKLRSRMGLTMAKFNLTSMNILLGIDPSWRKVKKEQKE